MLNPIGVREEQVAIGEIPALTLTPRGEGPWPTMIFYHGWSSCKENQRFRGKIFASYGWQVLLPDEPLHGERGTLDYENPEVVREHFFPIVIEVLKEFPKLLDYLRSLGTMKEGTLSLCGHSMGAIIAGGVLANYKEPVAAAALNGIWDWEAMALAAGARLSEEEREELKKYSPLSHGETLREKRFFLGNGESDQVVNPALQKAFYEQYKEGWGKDENHLFLTFPDTAHVTTTQMMEGAVMFLEKGKK